MSKATLLDLYELSFDFGEEVLIKKEDWCARHLRDRKWSSVHRNWDRLKAELRKLAIGVQFPSYEIVLPGQDFGARRGIGLIIPRGSRSFAEKALNGLLEDPPAKAPAAKAPAPAQVKAKQDREALESAVLLAGAEWSPEDLCDQAEVKHTKINLLLAQDLLTVVSVPRGRSVAPLIPWSRTESSP